MNYDPSTMNSKKYTLKPGKHQFAPGSHATHHNGNLTDAEAEWYLERYPHIKSLFEPYAENESGKKTVKPKSVRSKQKSVQSQTYEDLSTTN